MVRFFSLSFLALIGAMGLVGCGSGGEETTADPNDWRSQVKTIRIGVKGSEEDPIVLRRWEALEEMLGDVTGLPVKVYEASDYNGIIQALASGQIERNESTSGSLCDAIITPAPGQITFPIMQRLCGPGLVVPEDDCLRAMVQAFARLKLVLEPGGAIALAAALYHGDQIEGEDVICVASGGNVDPELFAQALAKYGHEI